MILVIIFLFIKNDVMGFRNHNNHLNQSFFSKIFYLEYLNKIDLFLVLGKQFLIVNKRFFIIRRNTKNR